MNLNLSPLILDCKTIMTEFQDCQAILIYREANVVIDFLVKLAQDRDEGQNGNYFLEHPHKDLLIFDILIFWVLPTREM